MTSGGFYVGVVVDGVMYGGDVAGEAVIPFGCEYDIELRGPNNGRRSVAFVYIDGVCVTPNGYVVSAYGSTYLKRPTQGSDQRFKFASVDSAAAHAVGKGGPDTDGSKGLIRVEFRAEKPRPQQTYSAAVPRNPWNYAKSFGSHDIMNREMLSFDTPRVGSSDVYATGAPSFAAPTTSEGVTVGGSKSDQSFVTVDIQVEDGPPVVVQVKLKGYTPQTYASPYPQGSPDQMPYKRFCQFCGASLRDPLNNRCSYCGQVGR